MSEIVAADAHRPGSGVNFMLDQCHNIEGKIPGQIISVLNVEQALAKALQVDQAALAAAQREGDVLGAHQVLMDAYETDVRAALADRREARGLPRDPVKAFQASGYARTVAAERVGGTQASWGA
jgi:L-rhamnose isomerase/sugar isomerase